jgi:hypothetical protein
MEAALLGTPVIIDDLVEDQPALLVIEVVDLGEVNLIDRHIIDGIQTDGD